MTKCKLDFFLSKRLAVQADVEETDVHCCRATIPTGSTSDTSVMQPSIEAGSDDFDEGLSQQKHDTPMQPVFPRGRNG